MQIGAHSTISKSISEIYNKNGFLGIIIFNIILKNMIIKVKLSLKIKIF